MKLKYLAHAAIAITVILATSANAALTMGDTISVQYYFPDLSSPYSEPNTVIYAGPGQTIVNAGYANFILSDNSITLTSTGAFVFTSAIFNGPVLKDLTNTSAFNGWTLTNDTLGLSSFFIDGSSPGGSSLGANWQGQQISTTGAATFSDPAGAVPEPATWAMMLAGFGMIGFAARRRSSVKSTMRFA